ncbi:uncharacterized protein LOC143537248 [Bidens hawaiensis]|uniref:uncharacterized protein LOC143537248 n=1 Tax=Bidens hawaiensis TaxID=980011 RepID=UPI00404AA6D3
MVSIINVVCASSKRHEEVQISKADEVKRLMELGEINLGSGLNQVGTLKRAGDTRWGSHYNSVSYGYMQSFEFVFILHLMKGVLGRTYTFSQALQKKTQNIHNAMELVSSIKTSLDDYRNTGCVSFLVKVTCFCNKHIIEMSDMKAPYTSTRYRPRKKDLHVTFEHYYRVYVFTSILDKQLHELDGRFNDHTMELLSLSSSLASKKINVDEICLLVEKYYPGDFTEPKRTHLRDQLVVFNVEMTNNTKLSGISSISDLCKILVETQKCETYYLVDRLIRLIVTLLV